ncbi:hypothetical protein ASD39_14385 [Sphingomonas sp. Root50]|nr:hypothetical protein ASD17_11190 [Sphingomonas sp. Root1294]KQY65326.1 hypothetical protein ASD39_14385 [Sphingomonas sp. Root50]
MECKDDGRITVHGDKDNAIYGGFTCIKGREIGAIQSLPSRLLRSQRRGEGGEWVATDWRQACAEIGRRLNGILADHGPRSVATYLGTYAYFTMTGFAAGVAFTEALHSPMMFHSGTIDQPGKVIAAALHGPWLAGTPPSDSWDTILFMGTNPLITMNGGLGPNPSRKMLELKRRGVKVIVADPRRTETAKHADLFLQSRPGTDAELLAGLIHVLIADQRIDGEFLAAETVGLDRLTQAVAPFTPERAAAIAGIAVEELIEAAHILGEGRSGIAMGGTGLNMSGQSSLAEYLIMTLATLRGWRLRAGAVRNNPGVLIQPFPPLAASPGPFPARGIGEEMRVRGLSESAAGLPTAALIDEILTPGPGQVRALVVVGGNPLAAFPNQSRALEAMKALDLLVCIDPKISATGRHADYLLAPKMQLEVQGSTAIYEWFGAMMGSGFGYERPYAQLSPAVVEPPASADLAEDWQFLHEILRSMGRSMSVKPMAILDPAAAAEAATALPMDSQPTSDDLWRAILKGSPVPYDELVRQPQGRIYDMPEVRIQPRPEGWPGRMDIGAVAMMEQLAILATGDSPVDLGFPWRLISRRLQDVINSNWHDNSKQQRRWRYNPAFLHPDDLTALAATPGDLIRISSSAGAITGVVQQDLDVKPGCISMSHCWGGLPGDVEDPWLTGGSTSRLVTHDVEFDEFSGIPRMSGIPVRLEVIARLKGRADDDRSAMISLHDPQLGYDCKPFPGRSGTT